MVRRPLKNSTGNKSDRAHDYQELKDGIPIKISRGKESRVIFTKEGFATGEKKDDKLAILFYAKSDKTQEVKIIVYSNNEKIGEQILAMSTNWQRYYLVIDSLRKFENIKVVIEPINILFLWGFNIVLLDLELMREKLDSKITVEELKEILSNDALMPEIAYANHDKPLEENITIINKQGISIDFLHQEILKLKYCSLCNRLLPAKDNTDTRLAFHKHKPQSNGSFRSGFQQECRACKNRNINKKLNPKRTADQFFESSLLARERKAFLEEPEIFDTIQRKYKLQFLGFKTAIWKKFDKKCFNCNKPLKVNDVELDHTRPMSLFYPLDEYATSLCWVCNNAKRGRHPADFYPEEKLIALSKITGLPLVELKKKEFNPIMLKKIISNIEKYGKEWSPNFFFNTRDKIKEYHPEIDILDLYEKKTGKKYSKEITKN
jgi:5-methylcytosine-specific restriction endonuclease McrA